MTTKDEALKLALESITKYLSECPDPSEEAVEGLCDAASAARKALAAPVQEPYGQVTVVRNPGCAEQHWFYRWPEPPYLDNAAECHMVYTTPPAAQRQWVGLTDEERTMCRSYDPDEAVAKTETKLKEKNHAML